MRRLRMAGPVVSVVLALAACSSGVRGDRADPAAPDVVAVASFNFPESELLAEIYSQSFEANGYKVHRSFRLGPRELVVPALVRGLVDFVPEYAGTALQFLRLGQFAPETDSARTHRALGRTLADLPVRALAPAPAQDANAFVVRQEIADRYSLETLSDLALVSGYLVFGGPPECATRPLCLAGLDRVYDMRFGEVVSLDAGGPLTQQALAGGGIDVALLFTTDPAIEGAGLVELTDDRHLQPAENITPLVQRDVVTRLGAGLADTADVTSAHLTTDALRDLNEQVDDRPGAIPEIAARWLDEEGLT